MNKISNEVANKLMASVEEHLKAMSFEMVLSIQEELLKANEQRYNQVQEDNEGFRKAVLDLHNEIPHMDLKDLPESVQFLWHCGKKVYRNPPRQSDKQNAQDQVDCTYRNHPNNCPFCGCDQLVTGTPITVADDKAFAGTHCLECGRSWTDNFVLTGITEIEEPNRESE